MCFFKISSEHLVLHHSFRRPIRGCIRDSLEADPPPLVRRRAQWGAGLGEQLPWLEPPPRSSLLEGQELLRQLRAVDTAGTLTAHGRTMAGLGLHPRPAHLLLRARALGAETLGCALAVS